MEGTERLDVWIRSAGYEEKKETIRDVRFRVHAGELIGLIGPNGAGRARRSSPFSGSCAIGMGK